MSSSRKKRRREKGRSTTSVLSFEDDEDHADGEIAETFKVRPPPAPAEGGVVLAPRKNGLAS